MSKGDLIGYAAAVCVFVTFYMKTMVPLRVAGIVSNVLFISYGYAVLAYPVLALHVVLLPLNIVRLRQMQNLVKSVHEAATSGLDMNWIRPFSTVRSVSAGEVLFLRGDVADELFVVVSGQFRLTEIDINFGKGEVVGELGMLNPDRTRTATLECIESGQLLRIDYDQLKQLHFQNPKFGFYFLQLATSRLFENNARLQRELEARRLPG
jgi:CRP/FNR family transcriptional regulator, cyclic AMP receptor protein